MQCFFPSSFFKLYINHSKFHKDIKKHNHYLASLFNLDDFHVHAYQAHVIYEQTETGIGIEQREKAISMCCSFSNKVSAVATSNTKNHLVPFNLALITILINHLHI